jgi:O-antigen ligase
MSIKFAPKIYDRVFQDDAEGQLEGRSEQIEETIPLILRNPIVGVGYSNDRFYASVIFVHNVYMLIAAEIGVTGFICYLWFLFEIFREIWAISRSGVLYCANYGRGVLAGMLGFCLASWVGPDFWINYGVQSYFWLVLALLFALGRLKRVLLFKQRQMALQQQGPPLVATS